MILPCSTISPKNWPERERTPALRRKKSSVLNIKQSAIASYESGRSRPTYENLVKLADFYDVTCDWLLGAKRAAEAERLEREEISKAFGGSIKLDTMTDDEIEMIKSILK